MKTNSILFIAFISITVLLATPSCKKNKDCGETNISSAGGDDSHNFGQNCMSCHKIDGKGEGCFVVAGSVSNSALTNPLTSGTVRLYTQANGGGTLKHTIQIDSKGNFHTTDNIDFTGLYAAVTGPSGTTQYMSSSLSSGACNSCHGSSTSKLWGN
jgi:cytochrome c553